VTGSTDLEAIFAAGDRSTWRWTLMIGLPDQASDAELSTALEAGRRKLVEPFASNLRTETFTEGRAAQLLHVGPYAAERQSIERLQAAIAASGFVATGRHHEIYLGDPRRAAPERLKTILRQPITSRQGGSGVRCRIT
jgi:hypothetical protein